MFGPSIHLPDPEENSRIHHYDFSIQHGTEIKSVNTFDKLPTNYSRAANSAISPNFCSVSTNSKIMPILPFRLIFVHSVLCNLNVFCIVPIKRCPLTRSSRWRIKFTHIMTFIQYKRYFVHIFVHTTLLFELGSLIRNMNNENWDHNRMYFYKQNQRI